METIVKIVAIVQARMGSKRLPGKVLKKIIGKSCIEILLSRLSRSKLLDEICVATSVDDENDILCEETRELGYKIFRGSEDDVLERYYQVATATSADVIVRITGDCPLVEASLVDRAIKLFLESNADYVSNINPPSFPDGLDVEVFKRCTRSS